ncbi:hypothetical protein BCR44DRAFT_195475 [Catenaria anguillulae PL171]|uniref:YEATS domain-containing protein n=1 Tax=Catenaria anguillulae PL171 TaxID=765915 RepID=A0A1Y2HMH1_9FUNG|nr:hypothetical protein BCR44DRAFT_195475 [Catenaria anguillulae PL171]
MHSDISAKAPLILSSLAPAARRERPSPRPTAAQADQPPLPVPAMSTQDAHHVRDRLLFQLDMELYMRQQEQATIERQLADAENTLRVLRQLQATGTYHETVHAYQTWFASGAAAAAAASAASHHQELPASKAAPSGASSRRSTPANSPAITARRLPAGGVVGGTASARTSRAATPVPSAPPSPPRPLPMPLATAIPAPPPSTVASADSASNSGTATTTTAVTGPSANQLLFVKLDDNSFIQLTCPNCDRLHFKSILALINHARSSHKVTYRSQMDFIRKFNTPVADSDVPLDHPCRTKPPISLSGGPLDLPTQPPLDRDVPQGEAGMTRFHYVRQVQVGNLSRSLPEANKRPPAYPGGPPTIGRGVLDEHTGIWHTHQWVAYVKESPWSEPCQVYVTRVRFHLLDKEQYPPPLNVVDVDEPPFSVTRTGRDKAFPVKVEVFFADPDKNRPAMALFDMKMDQAFTGRDVQGHLAMLDVELDKDTDFTNRKILNVQARAPMSPSSSLAVASTSQDHLDDPTPSPSFLTLSSPSSRLYPPIPASITPYIHHLLPDFPLIHARPPPTLSVPYTVARSTAEFQSWPLLRQRAVEWLRARSLAVAIETQVVPDLGFDNQVRMKAARLTTKRLVLWLRECGLSPGVDVEPMVGPPDWAIEGDDDEDEDKETREEKVCSGCGFITNQHTYSTCPMVPLLPIPPPPAPTLEPPADGQLVRTSQTLDLRGWQPHIPMTLYDPRIAAMIESWIAPLSLPTFQSLAHMIGSTTRPPPPAPLPSRPVAFRDPTGVRLIDPSPAPYFPPPTPPELTALHPADAHQVANRRHQYFTDPALPMKPAKLAFGVGLPVRPPAVVPPQRPHPAAVHVATRLGARPAHHPTQPYTHAGRAHSRMSPLITRFDGTLGRREHTYALLGEVMQVFLRRLVSAAVDAAREEREASADPKGVGGKQVLVPRHVAMGVVRSVQKGGGGSRVGLEWLVDGWMGGGGGAASQKVRVQQGEEEEDRMDVDLVDMRHDQVVERVAERDPSAPVSVKTEPGIP